MPRQRAYLPTETLLDDLVPRSAVVDHCARHVGQSLIEGVRDVLMKNGPVVGLCADIAFKMTHGACDLISERPAATRMALAMRVSVKF